MPNFAILRWDEENFKWVVEHYCMEEEESIKRLKILKQNYPGHHFELMIGYDKLADRLAFETLKRILGLKKK